MLILYTEDGKYVGQIKMLSLVVMEHSLIQMEKNMKVNGRMQNYMAKESTLDFMEKSMKGNGSMGFIMVKGYTLFLIV